MHRHMKIICATGLLIGLTTTGCGTHVISPELGTARTASNKSSVPPRTSVVPANKDRTSGDNSPVLKGTPGPNLAPWFTVDYKRRIMTVKLIAGYKGRNNGWNFNGYSNGQMVIVVPIKWSITVTVVNADKRPHNVVVTGYSTRLKTSAPPVFKGASTGSMGSGNSQSFTFKPTEQGQFALVSTVSSDTARGMWEKLFVVGPHSAPGIGAK